MPNRPAYTLHANPERIMNMNTTCPRTSEKCSLCGLPAGDECPLDEAPPFAGPAIGAAVGAAGECSDGDVCEACQ
jgi:hypothetical protein